MRPKQYYDQFTIQEDSRYIFTIMPDEFELQYKKFIKEPIESIELDSGKVTCESYHDLEIGTETVNEIWKNIQKAVIVIANITGFNPKVMLELGVALMKKNRIILIAEKSLERKANLPVNIGTLKVQFYEPNKMAEFSDWLKNQILNWITPEEPRIKDPDVIGLMNDALQMRREEKFSTAYLLFENMDKKEPANWYIYKEWGITYKEDKKYEEALNKLEQALDYAKRTIHRSEIYTEMGIVFSENKMVENALVAFQKAENLDRENADLYDKWAETLYTFGKYNEAMDKMKEGVRLDSNNEVYKLKFDFYARKFVDPNLSIDLNTWIREKMKPSAPQVQSQGRSLRNVKHDFDNFTRRYRIGEILEGKIEYTKPNLGIFVRLAKEIIGLVSWKRLPGNFDLNQRYAIGKSIRVKIIMYKPERYHIELDEVN